jgi:deazaflavin-dependent oxidoreductase (nitroreductase family)
MHKGIWGMLTSSPRAMIPRRGTPAWYVWKVIQDANTALYRVSRGRISGKFDRAPVVILHHVGRKSGEKRTTPLIYLQHGDDIVIVGSMGGAPKHPAWSHNIRAAGTADVEIRGRRFPVDVRDATDAEREALWPELLEMWPAWQDYTTRTSREFPIFILAPAIKGQSL